VLPAGDGAANGHGFGGLVPSDQGLVRYTDCNLSPRRGVHTRKGMLPAHVERAVFSCDYNGWADVPEEEREGIDAFEAAHRTPPAVPAPPVIRAHLLPSRCIPQQRAA
jgi:hypothetical protein